jgi:hypothetical protein
VEVGMVMQRLPPGMQHREEPDVRAQMVRIAGYGQQGLGHSLKEEGIQHPRVLEREWAKEMWKGNPTASFNSPSNVLVLKGVVTSRSWLT